MADATSSLAKALIEESVQTPSGLCAAITALRTKESLLTHQLAVAPLDFAYPMDAVGGGLRLGQVFGALRLVMPSSVFGRMTDDLSGLSAELISALDSRAALLVLGKVASIGCVTGITYIYLHLMVCLKFYRSPLLLFFT